jgi:hypothetical protein
MAKTAANVLVGVASLYYNPTPGTAVGGTGWVELGYTEDGLTLTYTAETVDMEVEEETFPLKRVLSKESLEVSANLAESSLVNLSQAMGGGILAGSAISLGAGALKEIGLKVVGSGPGAVARTVYVPYATATGAVGVPFKKGSKTVVPVTFQAFKHGVGVDVATVTDA